MDFSFGNITADIDAVVASMPTHTMGGSVECQRRAAYCTVHGPGGPYCPTELTRNVHEWPCPGSGIGFPCFRPDATRMLIPCFFKPPSTYQPGKQSYARAVSAHHTSMPQRSNNKRHTPLHS